jgi:AraC-like DNA-binding protein
MKIADCNPFLRVAGIQPAVLEGGELRAAYDHRIFYILGGTGELVLAGDVIPLQPDTLLFLAPRTPYYFCGKMRVAVFNFDLTRGESHRTDPICPPPVAALDEALLFDRTLLDAYTAPLVLPHSERLREDILQLADSFSEGDAHADALTSALLKKLLAELFADKRRPSAAEALIDRVRRHIRLFATEIEGNEALAAHFGYHPVYLASLFRELTGNTLHRAILTERVRVACEYLTRTDRSIEEIAADTGFATRNHFCTVFKKFTGLSPLAYRNRL